MTNPDDLADHLATGPADDSEVIAGAIADAAERIADTWAAGQQGGPRLTATQLRALRALELRPAVSLTALASRLDMGLPAASRMCDRLEAAGLVARTVHPFSRRAIQLALTVTGHHVMRELSAHRVRILAGVVRKMKPAERGALRRGIAAFQKAAQAGEGGA
ncbi:MarR family winged helix-turn-helix transcriptional regulator [Streptomyces sp. NPDC048512]|uniref:MarR family winged helix-turn-helix transcriptional regulator n=1 Tax=Streptomyces sp. NPDC048512 TaxID=3365563 RepID=UPI003719C7BF